MSNCLLFPAELLDVFDERNWSWGYLNLRIDDAQGVMTVAQARHGNTDEVQRFDGHWSDTRHYLRYADVKPYTAVWYRADPGLHVVHDQLRRRAHSVISTDFFRSFVPSGWVIPGGLTMFVVTVTTPAIGEPGVSVWRVDDHDAVPEASSIVDGRLRPLEIISDVGPRRNLPGARRRSSAWEASAVPSQTPSPEAASGTSTSSITTGSSSGTSRGIGSPTVTSAGTRSTR